MKLTRRQVVGLAVAPLVTPLVYLAVVAVTQGLGLDRKITLSTDLPMLLFITGYFFVIGAVVVLVIGIVAAQVFARSGITGLGPHLVVGALGGMLPGAAMRMAGASLLGAGLGVASALVYWLIARPQAAARGPEASRDR
jgi:hypothetical protein